MAHYNANATSLGKPRTRELFESEDAFASSLIALLVDAYTTDVFTWEPEVIGLQVQDDFTAIIPKNNMDKIMSLILSMTTLQFYTDWSFFNETCKSLNGEGADPDSLVLADPEDLAWGVTEIALNDPPDDKIGNGDYSPEVCEFAGRVLSANGIWQPPKLLSFAALPENAALNSDLSDDPTFFETAMKMQQDERTRLEQYVGEKYRALLAEVKSLPINVGVKLTTPN